jgi:sialidase-1
MCLLSMPPIISFTVNQHTQQQYAVPAKRIHDSNYKILEATDSIKEERRLPESAPTPKFTVFKANTDKHSSYRIPAIIGLSNGDLLAFCEGRKEGSADFGDINIVMKRSRDSGKTWSPIQTIVDYGVLQAGNPAPVVDRTDPNYPKGRIFLFYNTGNNHEHEVRKGNGLREVWYISSVDQGHSWSEPTNITTSVHRPMQPQTNSAYQFAEDWRGYANTPGHAVQFPGGKFKGRIFVAANHSAGDPKSDFTDYDAHGFYSDDHGKTFHLGSSLQFPGSNESTATYLSADRLMINSRNQQGHIPARIVGISRNGGLSWDTTYFDYTLPDPVCQGALLTLGKKNGRNILAFCNPADPHQRDNLTLRISFDDGQTWPQSVMIEKSEGTFDGAFTAYSDIVRLKDGSIGVLYERDHYREITFTRIPRKVGKGHYQSKRISLDESAH